MSGSTVKDAKLAGGYAPATARSNAPRVSDCIDEAKRLAGGCDPATLLDSTRRAFGRALESYSDGDLPLDRLARVVETAERWYGQHGGDLDGPAGDRTIVQRLTFVRNLVLVADQRGLLGSAASDQPQVVENKGPEVSASDNSHSVNLGPDQVDDDANPFVF